MLVWPSLLEATEVHDCAQHQSVDEDSTQKCASTHGQRVTIATRGIWVIALWLVGMLDIARNRANYIKLV
jgi:hypothetical protein